MNNDSQTFDRDEQNLLNSEMSQNCPCCWVAFGQGSLGKILPCLHTVCESCVKWVEEKSGSKMCPLCHKVFQSYEPTLVLRQRHKITLEKVHHKRHNTAVDAVLRQVNEIKLGTVPRQRQGNTKDTFPYQRDEVTVDTVHHQRHTRAVGFNSQSESLNQRSTRLDEFLNFHLNATKDIITAGQSTLSGIETDIEDNDQLKKSFLRHNKQLEDIIKESKKHLEANRRSVANLDKQNIKLRSYLCDTEKKLTKTRAFRGKLGLVTTFQEAALITDEDPYVEVSRHLNSIDTYLGRYRDKRSIYQQVSEEQRNKLEFISECITCTEDRCDEESDEEESYEAPAKLVHQPACCPPRKLMAHRLRMMDHALKCHVIQGNVFAVQKYKCWERFSRLYLTQDGELLLGHLQEMSLPPTSFVVPYSEVMENTESNTNEMFLELRSSTSCLGRLHIKALSNCTRARHFQLLCTGEMGNSYANSRMLEVSEKGDERLEAVRCGDYENDDGTGGKSLVPISQFPSADRMLSTPAGTLAGIGGNEERRFAQFQIYTRHNLQRICSRSFARVSKGMDILLQTIVKHSNIGEVVIKECGVVLWSPEMS